MMYLAQFASLRNRLVACSLFSMWVVTVSGSWSPAHADPAPAPQVGMLLIADEDELDSRFRGALVLITSHQQSGSHGLVINRPTRFLLGELLFDYADDPSSNAHVHFGGPVGSEQLRFLAHSRAPISGADQIVEGLWFGRGDHGLPRRAQQLGGRHLRLFSGYVKWQPGELRNQLQSGRWKHLPVRAEYVFYPQGRDLWPLLWRFTRKNDWVEVGSSE